MSYAIPPRLGRVVPGLMLFVIVAASLAAAPPRSPRAAMAQRIDVNFQRVTVERAFAGFAAAAGLDLLIHWDRLEQQGYDRAALVTLQLNDVPARLALRLLLTEAFPDGAVVAEINPRYLRIRGRVELNEPPVVRLYDVADLLVGVPYFDDAPAFDLEAITSAEAAREGGGGGDSLFAGADESGDQAVLPKSARAERLIAVITGNIEPDIWQRNGGTVGRITYFQDKLVVRAPAYVHQRIGRPIPLSGDARTAPRAGSSDSATRSAASVPGQTRTDRPRRHRRAFRPMGGISGVRDR